MSSIDRSFSYMFNLYNSWKTQILESLNIDPYNCDINDINNHHSSNLIFCYGMGGSGISCDLLYIYSIIAKTQLIIYRYKHADPDLRFEKGREAYSVIVVSYSGNTPETIRVFNTYIDKTKAKLAAVSSGGYIGSESKKRRIPYYEIKHKNIPPRLAMPSLLIGTFKCLSCLSKQSIVDSVIDEFKTAANKIDRDKESIYEYANSIATKLASSIKSKEDILILSTWRYEPLVYRFYSELAENAKIKSTIGVFPEAGHNLVAALSDRSNIIYIHDPDSIESYTVLELLNRALARNSILTVVELPKELPYLGRFIYGSLIAGLTSISLAKILNIDPLNIEPINFYRKTVDKLYRGD